MHGVAYLFRAKKNRAYQRSANERKKRKANNMAAASTIPRYAGVVCKFLFSRKIFRTAWLLARAAIYSPYRVLYNAIVFATCAKALTGIKRPAKIRRE